MFDGIPASAGLVFFAIMGLAGTIGTYVLYQVAGWGDQWVAFLRTQPDLVPYVGFLGMLPEAMIVFYILAAMALASPVSVAAELPQRGGRRRRRRGR